MRILGSRAGPSDNLGEPRGENAKQSGETVNVGGSDTRNG